VSVAVARSYNGTGISVIREVISSMRVWDAVTHSAFTLEPGALLHYCKVRRNQSSAVESGAEPYVVQFESGGSRYECALVVFQPRTRAAGVRDGEAIAV
jgi:hypothetical protein